MTTEPDYDSIINLRAVEPDDVDLLYGVENDRSLWQASGCTSVPYSRELLRNYILSTTGDIYADKQLRLIVEMKRPGAEPAVIGIVDLANFDPRNSRAEVGIVILGAYRKKGYASYVVERLARYAANMLSLHQLYALIPEDNGASRKLFRKCGFTERARLDDWLCCDGGYKAAVLAVRRLGNE